MLCLHCGKEENLYYCEKCINDLISENLKLQVRIKDLEKQLQESQYEPKHMKEDLFFLTDKDWVEKNMPKIR